MMRAGLDVAHVRSFANPWHRTGRPAVHETNSNLPAGSTVWRDSAIRQGVRRIAAATGRGKLQGGVNQVHGAIAPIQK